MIPLRLRQLLAVLILLSLISLLLWLVVGPLLSRFQSDEEVIADLQQRLQVYQRLVTELPAQEARLAELKQDSPMSRLLFAESRPALAGAELQQQIGQLVGQSGAQVVSTQILSRESAEAPVPAVGIKVHLRGETEQLVRLLFDLANHEPLLLVENIVVLSTPRVDMQRIRSLADLKAVP
jgi:general secretion pathway protein M